MNYSPPTDSDQDQVAHILSELLNDNAPIGWERYKYAADCLLRSEAFKRLYTAKLARESL